MNAPAPIAITAADLVEIARALGISKQATAKKAEAWPFEGLPVRGGLKRYYPIATLPADVREKVQIARLNQQVAALPAPVTPLSPSVALPVASLPVAKVALRATGLSLPAVIDAPDLTSKQLDVERARDRLLDYVAQFPGAIPRAIDHLNAERYAGRLPVPLVWAFDNAWDKPRASNRLTLKTYHNWKKSKATRGRSAPKKVQPDMAIKPWYGLLLALRQRPQGSCYNWIHKQIRAQWDRAWGDEIPSYDAVRRVCVEKLSVIAQLKGRYTGSALRQHKHWNPRTSKGMYPWQEVHADGWNTHFTAPHPIHGEFVTYEVWHFHDVATRFVPPPGIGLTETYEVITAGLERAVRVGGVMAVLQTDSTKVVKRSPRFTANPWAALSERAGIMVVHPTQVGNSQANGICENFNTWLDKQSRELATYQGKGMDSLSLKRVKKITEKMVKAISAGDLAERDRLKHEAERMGKGRVFMSYEEAVAWINATCDAWNDKPHRELPKVEDPITGERRHQTPREAMQQHISDGWEPVSLSEEHLIDLFRPHVICKVTRESISPIGNKQRYKFDGLGAWNGQEVMAAVDPMDWRAVWVKSLQGEFIGLAELVSASGYRAQSMYELAEEKRANAQLKRQGIKTEHIKARTKLSIPAPSTRDIVIGGQSFSAAALSSINANAETAQPRGERESMGEMDQILQEVAQAKPTSRTARTPEENYADWQEIDRRILAGEPVTDAEANWHQRYQQSAQYRAAAKRKAAA